MIFTKNRYSVHYLFLLFLIQAISGCMESRVSSTEDLPGSQVRGTVRLLSEDNSFAINKNLVLVKLEGTGFETLTDTAGRWTLNLVPKGSYTISYSKPGYTTSKRYSIRIDGAMPMIINPMTLVQIPPYSIDSISLQLIDDSLEIQCRISESGALPRRAILYFDSLAIDSNLRNRYVFTDINMVIESNQRIGITRIPLSRFINSGFRSGQLVHCSAFGIIRFEATADESYFAIDPITKKTVFWNVNPLGEHSQFLIP